MCNTICRMCLECTPGIPNDGSEDTCRAMKNRVKTNLITGTRGYVELPPNKPDYVETSNKHRLCSLTNMEGNCVFYEPLTEPIPRANK